MSGYACFFCTNCYCNFILQQTLNCLLNFIFYVFVIFTSAVLLSLIKNFFYSYLPLFVSHTTLGAFANNIVYDSTIRALNCILHLIIFSITKIILHTAS